MACDRISGAHKLYYAPYGTTSGGCVYLGATGPEGINQIREFNLQDITSDELGPNTIIDHVYQGENMSIEFVMQEVNKDICQMFLHPFQCTYASGVATAVKQEHFGAPGRLGCGVYGVLEAIPTAFSTAEGYTGGSATGTSGTYPGTPATTPTAGRQWRGLVVGTITESLDTRARFIPVRFQCYPFVDASDSNIVKHWKWISAASSSLSITW
jgi:hypothetical protein